ncbi:MAG: glycosyltransferase family 4 protein [Candidatus Thorarchaeota archaeon]
MKAKIINILYHLPIYEYIWNNERPEINWDISDGSWVGIWRGDFPDQLGSEILKLTKEFEYEVWQPDLRADRIYSHRFNDGILHRKFPALYRKKILGIKFLKILESPEIINTLHKEKKMYKTIIHLNSDPTIFLNSRIISTFGNLPIINSFHGVFLSPKAELYKLRKNFFTTIGYFYKYRDLKGNLTNIDLITYQNNKHVEYLKSINYKGQIERITMGCDFNFWVHGNKEISKKEFNVVSNTMVFSMASRFNNLKQIDKVIDVFTEIDKNGDYNFILLIAGRGNKEYEEYLINVSRELSRKGKLRFTGYLRGTEMLKLYQASDFFISASIMEGCSVSVIKALACEVPILSTKVGGTYELMKQHGAGKFIETQDYENWKTELGKILSGERIKVMDRKIAKDYFHWPNIASKFINIYNKLAELR